jgi:Outer membrane lipoprotein-sorting protein
MERPRLHPAAHGARSVGRWRGGDGRRRRASRLAGSHAVREIGPPATGSQAGACIGAPHRNPSACYLTPRSPPSHRRRTPGDPRAQKAILFFLAPAEVKGTGFLAFTHKGRPADQWLYLPELKRVRQITARRRKESFVGTDLSYHDLDLIQEWRRGRRPTRARASVPRR